MNFQLKNGRAYHGRVKLDLPKIIKADDFSRYDITDVVDLDAFGARREESQGSSAKTAALCFVGMIIFVVIAYAWSGL